MSFNKEKIQELYPGAKMYEAQKISKGTESLLKSACNSGEYFGELKKDGYWYQYEKYEHNSYLFSRSASTVTGLQSEKSANVPHIVDALSSLPDGTILVGEIYYPNGSSKNVTSIMGCLPTKAIERQNGSYGKIHYYIHDILMYKNIDFVESKTNNWTRYNILKKIYYLHGLDKYDFLELAAAETEDLYSQIGDALAAGEEGMVIKKKDGIYEPGKRPTTMLKAKKVDFIDAVVIGFEEPTKEYYGKEIESWQYWVIGDNGEEIAVTKPYYMGWCNSRIKIGVYNEDGSIVNIGTIHSGISDEMKEDMSKNPEKYLNKVCAIQCMELDKNEHTIRHGFFKFMREDKDAKDCRLIDVFGQK